MRIPFLQSIINKLRGGKIFAIATIVSKYECSQRIKDYHTLALGSSHMAQGYIPKDGEINMASPAQDLYYSYNLYKNLNNEDLKKVLISFSVFTPGDFIIKSKLLYKCCVLFKLLYNIPYQDIECAKKLNLEKLEKAFKKQIAKYRKRHISENYRGESLSSAKADFSQSQIDQIKYRATRHLKINQKEEKNMEFCIKLLEDTQNNSQEIYFVLPPTTDFYKSVLPTSDVLFAELYNACKNYAHAHIINLYDSNEFSNEDFADGDHLNYDGSVKFTKIVQKIIDNKLIFN